MHCYLALLTKCIWNVYNHVSGIRSVCTLPSSTLLASVNVSVVYSSCKLSEVEYSPAPKSDVMAIKVVVCSGSVVFALVVVCVVILVVVGCVVVGLVVGCVVVAAWSIIIVRK